MAGSLAEPSPATTLSPPNPSPSLSLAPNLMDRLPLELKMAVVEDCCVEGGKPLLLRLMGTWKELQQLGRPFIYQDLSFTITQSSEPLAAESLALESDKTFDLFTSLSREHGHLIKSVRLQRAPHGKWQYQRDISNIRWEGFKDSLPHLTSLQRLDISEFTSLTGARPNIDGDDYLLRAAPTFSNTLTSLRLSSGVERFYMYPSRLAELLNTLPLLTFLDLDDVATSHWTSRPQYYASLKAAIGNLRHLKWFGISEVASNFLADLHISGPLEVLDDRGSITHLPEVIEVIRPHEATLQTLNVRGMLNGGDQTIPADADTLRFPHLRALSLDSHLNLSFVSRFNSSPLQLLRIVQDNSVLGEDEYIVDPVAERWSVVEVLRILEVHKATLKRLDVRIMNWRHARRLLERVEEELEAGEDTVGTRALKPWRVVMDRCRELGIETKWK